MDRTFHMLLAALLVWTVAGCSDIERPRFGVEPALSGQLAGVTETETAYAATLSIDVIKGPDNGAPRPISPGLFGAAENLGQIGINSDTDIRQWVANTSLSVLKWGGTAAESFDWEADGLNGALYTAGDGTRPEKPQMTLIEFLDLCRSGGVEPIIVVSAQVNDAAKAARLVEFLNSPDTTQGMGLARAKLSRHGPYAVTLFQIGDDPLGTLPRNQDRRCHFGKPFAEWRPCTSPDGDTSFADGPSYAALTKAYASAMRAAQGGDKIRIIAAGFPDEIAKLEADTPGTVDYLDAPYYPFTGAEDPAGWGSTDQLLDAAAGGGANPSGSGPAESFDTWFAGKTAPLAGTDIKLSIGEWNMDADGLLRAMGSYRAALWAADIMGRMARSGAGIGAFYSIESSDLALASPFTGDFGYMRYEQATGRRIKKALRVAIQFYSIFVNGAYVDSAASDARLVTHTAWHAEGRSFALVAINRDPLNRASVTLAWAGGQAPVEFTRAWSVEEDAPEKSTGTTGPRADRVWCAPDLSRCSLPPFSVSVITGN